MYYNLSSKDLEQFLFNDSVLLNNVGGIFSVDNLPENVNFKKIFIINSDPSYLPGEHWLAVFFPSNSLPEFFDSFGKSPSQYSQSIFNFLIEKDSRGFVYNCKRIQSTQATSCGLFCLYYLYFRIRGFTFASIMERFGRNLEHNDVIVSDFYSLKD